MWSVNLKSISADLVVHYDFVHVNEAFTGARCLYVVAGQILDKVNRRVEWTKYQQRQQQQRDEEADRERGKPVQVAFW